MRFPHTLSLHDARDIHSLHCHFERSEKSFSFPSSFAKPFRGSTVPAFPAIQCFPFLAVGHAPSYRQRKRSLGFARDDVAEVAFSQHILYTGRGLSIPPPTIISSAGEKSSLHSVLPCPFRGRLPILLCHTYDAIPVCKKDPSASLGMTIRE